MKFASRWLGFCLLLGLLLSTAGAWLLSPRLPGHGLLAQHGPAADRLEAVALLTSNDAALTSPVFPVRWTGYLFQPTTADVIFRVPVDVGAVLTLDGQTIFSEGPAAAPASDAVRVHLAAGVHPIELQFISPRRSAVYLQAGLEWWTVFGWRLVPADYLYPAAPDPQAAQRVILLMGLAAGAGWLAAAFGLGLVGWGALKYRRVFRSRTTWGLIGLVGLALALRLLFLADLVRSPGFDVLQAGADHRNYLGFALNGLRGLWPSGAFAAKPGISLLLMALFRLAGPSLRAAQVLQMILGALTVVVVFAVAREIFGTFAGWAAACLWAVFPLPMFYEAYVLTHGLESVAAACLLWLWLKALKSPGWRWTAAVGAWLGAAAILRPTFLALAPFLAVSLAWRGPAAWRARVGRLALCAAAVAVPILPLTWHNYQASGQFQLISAEGDPTLYDGNGRDSSGGVAEFAVGDKNDTHPLADAGKTTYLRQTLADIRANPVRWLQLMVRKTAFLFSDYEVDNDVDFIRGGVNASPTLAALPVRWGGMLALAIAGLCLARVGRRGWSDGLLILIIYVSVMALLFVAFVVYSRLKAPLYPPLVVLAGAAVAAFITALRRRQWRVAGGGLLVAVISRVAIANMLFVADHALSRPIVTALPPAAKLINAPMGSDLTLVGYDALPAVKPGEAAIIGLYWQSRRAWPVDLVGSLKAYSGANQWQVAKIAQQDHLMGAGLVPHYPTSQWTAGQIIRDQYLLDMPADASEPQALSLLVAACYQGGGDCVGNVTIGPLPLTRASQLARPADAVPVGATFGRATLAAYRVTADRSAGLTVTLYWQSGGPMEEDGVVFVHVLDSAGNLVAGNDGRPRKGFYSTLAWQPGETVVDEHTLTWPADAPPGRYRLEAGVYEAGTHQRWPATDANGGPVTNNVLALGFVDR